jgi:MAF protein
MQRRQPSIEKAANRMQNTTPDSNIQLVLASTSPFRRELLARLELPFVTASPEVDETIQPGETPEALVQRLAEQKARAVAPDFPHALIIGSDQVATIDDLILGKPESHVRACEQLALASGKKVTFYTGLCLYNTASERCQILCEPFHVYFRALDATRIERYLRREKPYNCAGSFKSEGLGITLFEKLQGDDPNTLIGLPLIRLVTLLKNEGIDPLANSILGN